MVKKKNEFLGQCSKFHKVDLVIINQFTRFINACLSIYKRMSIHLTQPLMFSSMDMKPALDEACAEAVGCDYHVVNECATGTHDCSSYSTCLDTFGRSTLFLVLVIPWILFFKYLCGARQ